MPRQSKIVRVASEWGYEGGMKEEGSAFAEATPKAFASGRRDRGWRIDCGLSSRRARCNAEGFFDRGRIVDLSAFDHGGDVAGVANVLRGVAID